ncbi:MAG: cysteine-rich small domain-containing protein [Lachnospiraceae bacterium]|nr:cysteine-rich small domain-containing protein [Lachnospiraceae bacterium]
MENSSRFFCNKDCEYFPCHKTADPDSFNCLFCYCPLYALGPKCGGNYRILPNGVKSCEDCLVPHRPGGYEHVLSRIGGIIELAAEDPGEEP